MLPVPKHISFMRFEHDRLDPERRQIRLITVQHRQQYWPLRCSIKLYDLDRYPTLEYSAVSYAWGPREPSHDIILNNKLYEIRANLYDFLEGVSTNKRAAEYSFWIDQICIDQHHNGEKTHQVQQMKTIFSNAREVIIWLGKDDWTSATAMSNLQSWTRGHGFMSSALGKCMLDFFGRPYWHRLWVVQEIVLARAVHLLCGDGCLKWSHLQNFFEAKPTFWDERSSKSLAVFEERSCAAGILASRPLYGAGTPHFPLNRALATFQGYQCENPRDKVYAVMGIVLADEQANLCIDYSKEVRDVYIDAALQVIYLEVDPKSTHVPDQISDTIIQLGKAMEILSDADSYSLATTLRAIRLEPEQVLYDDEFSKPLHLNTRGLREPEQKPLQKRLNPEMRISVIRSSEQAEKWIPLRSALELWLPLLTTPSTP